MISIIISYVVYHCPYCDRYFQSYGIAVMGVVFNKLTMKEGEYYHMNNCKEAIDLFFARRKIEQRRLRQVQKQSNDTGHTSDVNDVDASVYGFLPLLSHDTPINTASASASDIVIDHINISSLVRCFNQYVDMRGLLRDLYLYHNTYPSQFRHQICHENSGESVYQVKRGSLVVQPPHEEFGMLVSSSVVSNGSTIQ